MISAVRRQAQETRPRNERVTSEERAGDEGGATDPARDDPRDDGVADGANGRRYLVGAGVTVTAFAGIAGFVLGANSPADATTVLGVIALPVTPVSLAVYGILLAGTVVTGLFGLVVLASRLES